GDLGGRAAGPDQDGREDRAAADPVNTAGAAGQDGQGDQHGGRDAAGRPGSLVRGVVSGRAGGGQPDAQRQQQGGDQQVEDAGTGDQFDADDRSGDHAGQGPGDQEQGQSAAGLVLPPVPGQRAGGGHDVVEQVGGGDGGAGRAQHADLEWEQQDRPGDAGRRGDSGDDEGGREGH